LWKYTIWILFQGFPQVARDFTKSCLQFLKKLLKSSVLKKKSKVAFCKQSCSNFAPKTNKKNHFVALFLYLVWCKNMQTAQQKVRFLSIFEQFCGVTSVAK